MGNRRRPRQPQRPRGSGDNVCDDDASVGQVDDARLILELMRAGDATSLDKLAHDLHQAGEYEGVTGILIRALYLALEVSAGDEPAAAALAHQGLNAMGRGLADLT